MVSWRTVTGKIELLDPQLTSVAQIQEFFATERLLGRGAFTDPVNPSTDGTGRVFTFELAMAGRRRRIATLDEAGEIILGHTATEVLESLATGLRKVCVEFDGKTIHGPLDIGAVGVDEADLLIADLPESPAENTDDNTTGAETAPDESLITGAQVPNLADGPTLILGDFPLSELPSIAANENANLLNFKVGALQAIAMEDSFRNRRRLFPRPEIVIELSLGKHDFISPTLVVLRNSRRSVWEWKGELPAFEWFADSHAGMNFVRDELGAGAIARTAVADIVDVSFEKVRKALLEEPTTGARKLAQLLGIPAPALLFLAGKLDADTARKQIPDSRIFTPSTRHERLRQKIAWEVAGEGHVNADVAGVYRWMYLKRPWLVSLIAAGQAAVGGAFVSASFYGKKRSKLAALLGGALLANAVSRILTTGYVQNAYEKSDAALCKDTQSEQ